MHTFILENQGSVRIFIFALVLLIMVSLEYLLPRRRLYFPKKKRWSTNSLLLLTDVAAVRILMPIATVEMTVIAQAYHVGILNLFNFPLMINILIAIIFFDLLIYGQHVLFHKADLFWKIHRVHHTDLDFDVSTGIRFHPLEILLSVFIKMTGVLLLGPAIIAIVIYEILLSSAALFTHSNLRLPSKIDRILRIVFVTPDMHRIHHSVYKQETDSNYGNLFSCWDRLFNTYVREPRDGQLEMTIGLYDFRDEASQQYRTQVLLPIKT